MNVELTHVESGESRMSPIRKFEAELHDKSRETKLRDLLPSGMTPARFQLVIMKMVAKAPRLLNCTRLSLFSAINTCAELGLEPGGALGHAYIVPYKDQATFIPGYKGFIDLAYRTKEIVSVFAEIVYPEDKFQYISGSARKIEHFPDLDGPQRPDKMKYVYAIAKHQNGSEHIAIMTRRQVERVRACSKSANRADSPWTNYEEEMWKKSAIRQLAKVMPMSNPVWAAMLEADNEDSVFSDSPSNSQPPAVEYLPTGEVQELEVEGKA